MFDYVQKQKVRLIRNDEYRPKIFKTINEVVSLSTDYDFDNGLATNYETDVLVSSDVEMKSTTFSSDVPLGDINNFDNLLSNELKKEKK